MDIEQTLEQIGLKQNEIKTYLTLIDNGTSKAGNIAKKAKIDRSSCYNSLKKLIEKGLVSYMTVDKTKWFQATSPHKLMDYLKEQQTNVQSIMPQLEKRHNNKQIKSQFKLYKGKEGIKTIFEDIIQTGESNYVFGNESQLEEVMPAFQKQFVRRLKENNIFVKEIVREDRECKTSNPKQTRYVPKDVKSPVVTNIYSNKIALVIWTDEPEGLIIENETAAKAYKSYFEFMWQHAKKKNNT